MSVTSVMHDASKAVMRAMGSETDAASQDLLDTLHTEHNEVKALLKDLKNADTAPERTAIVEQIKLALVPHSKAEEKVLYAALVELQDKDSQVDGEEGTVEHALAAETLQKLSEIPDPTSSEHLATAKVLTELLEHHISEEESNVWRDAKDQFSEEERIAMNARYLSLKAQVDVL